MEPRSPGDKGQGSPIFDEVADEHVLDATFGRLLTAMEGDDHSRISSEWRDFETCLTAHMNDEEQRVTPRIAAIRLRDAVAILQEHRHLRARLKELGESIAGRDVQLENARSFREELRAHADHESAILSRLLGASGDRSKS